MMTVSFILAIGAFLCTIASAIGKCPLWVAVLLLAIIHLLVVMPR